MLRGMTNSIPPHVPVEPIMIANVLLLARTLAEHRGCQLTTIARIAHPNGQGDPPLFKRMEEGLSSIKANKYDELMVWFTANWPADLPWPMAPGTKAPEAPRQAAARQKAVRKTKK